jgi:hypothetical protein
MRITKDDIADLRGETPTACDYCQKARHFEELEPEEAGQWICHDCLRRWLNKDVERIRVLLKCVYDPVEAAKWWFTPQPYLAHRTPNELILCDHSESLVSQLEKAMVGTK